MESGKLRHQVTIQRPRNATGELGGVTQVWEDFLVDIRAEVLPLTAREQWQAQQVTAETDTKIRIRYRPGITAQMRVRHLRPGSAGSPQIWDYYDLTGDPIDVNGRHFELHLMCVKRSAEGFRTGEQS